MKKVVIILAALLLLGCNTVALAEELDNNAQNTLNPMYIGVQSIVCDIHISSTGVIRCTGSVLLANSYHRADVNWTLQRSNGSTWSNVTTWSTPIYSGSSTSLDKTRYANHGYAYRLVVTVKVYSSSGNIIATYTEYSKIVMYISLHQVHLHGKTGPRSRRNRSTLTEEKSTLERGGLSALWRFICVKSRGNPVRTSARHP